MRSWQWLGMFAVLSLISGAHGVFWLFFMAAVLCYEKD